MTLIDKINPLGIALGAGVLAVAAKQSQNVLIKSHGADALFPLLVYFVTKEAMEENLPFKKISTHGLAIFLVASGVEFAQKVGLYPGTYDPKDFIAYAAGATAAVGLDYLISKYSKKAGEGK